jgi:hypothetical protein
MVAENTLSLNIAAEFSRTPGPRFRSEGKFSGEEFRETILKNRLDRAMKEGLTLHVDLDGGYGYATSFLEEAFGGLARQRQYDPEVILKTLTIKSDEEPYLIEDIRAYIGKARGG